MYKLINGAGGLDSAISDKYHSSLSEEARVKYVYAGEDPEPAELKSDEDAVKEHYDALNSGQATVSPEDSQKKADESAAFQKEADEKSDEANVSKEEIAEQHKENTVFGDFKPEDQKNDADNSAEENKEISEDGAKDNQAE